MNIAAWIVGLPRRSLPARVAVLAAVMAAAYGCVVIVAANTKGSTGIAAASWSAGVCLASAAVALTMNQLLGRAANGLAGILLPMAVRTGLPLLLALFVRMRGQGLVEAGFIYYLVGFYLLALAVETVLSLPRAARPPQCPGDSRREG